MPPFLLLPNLISSTSKAVEATLQKLAATPGLGRPRFKNSNNDRKPILHRGSNGTKTKRK